MRMGERTKRVLALLTAGAMVFTNTGMDVLASTSIVVGGITSGEDKKGETPAESESESETGTEQESESESETGSEAESEAAYTDQKVFTCEGDQATVTVTVPDEAQMPAGTELEVQPMVENSVTYDEIKNALTNEAQEVLGISAFHLAFTTDGEAQIPSDIDYQVQIDYKDAVLAVAEGQEDSSVGAYVNQAGATADIQTSENGAVEAVSLSTKELGDVAVVRTGAVAEAKTVYTYEDANVIVTATIEKADAVPDDAKFVVTELNEEEHKADYEATEEELKKYAEEQQIGYTGYVIYDMHFEDAEGNEIEPEEGSVKVAVEYKSAKEISDDVNDTDSKVSVLHLDESQGNVNVEDITQDVEVNKKGEIEGAQFETVNFSTFVLARMVNTMDINVEAPDGTYYLAITDNSSNWLNVKSKVQEVVVSGGKTQITVPLNDNNGIGDKYEAVVLGLKDGKNYSENYDQNNYVVYKSGSYLNKNTGSYKISVTSKQGNSQTLKIEEVGTQATSMNGIINSIGNAANFMVVANSFIQHDHYEGNIATINFEPNGQPIGVNGTETKLNLTITVTKTVVPAESKSFKFGIYDAKGTLVKELQIVTDEYGKGIGSYTINDAKNSYKVYELNEKNEKLEDGATNGSYKVSYISSEGLDNIVANYGTSSFAKNVIGNKNLTANKDTVLYTTTDGVTMQNGEVEKVSSEEFDSMVDISGMLTNIGTLSSNLANTKTSGDVVVYNLNADELPIENGGHLKLPGIGSDQALVINVVIPNGTTEYRLGKDLNSFDVGNESLKISGYQTAANAALANRTVWNFVYENGSAYTGTVYQETTLGGTFLVPNGTIYAANSTPVALYAQTVNQYQGYSELHKGGFHTDVNKNANVSVKNEKKAALKIVKNVTVNNKATTSTLADGTYYFTIKKKDDPKFKAIHKSITIKNGESGKVEIEELEAGTYIVSEDTDKNPSGISLIGKNDIEVVVTAKNNGEIPTATFTNNRVYATGETTLTAEKELAGREFKAGDKWTFTVSCDTDGAPMPEHTTVTTDATSGYTDTLDFGKISYTLADAGKTYVYTITESGSEAGVTNDADSTRTVTVTVSDNGNGTLNVAKVEDEKGMTFTNTYAAAGETTLTAEKELTGREFKAGDAWTFTVSCDTDGAPMPEHTKVTTDAASGYTDALDFGKISYTLADAGKTYVYTITESGSATNVTNDPNSVRTVRVAVTDNGDGTLKVDKTEDVKGMTFVNAYSADGETTLDVTKVLSGREFKTGDAWTFELASDTEGAPMPAETSVTTDATSGNSQTLSFGKIQYSLADAGKTYVYKITESGHGDGVTNDVNNVRTITVSITDGGNGKLDIARTESEGGTVFTNTYAAAGETTLTAEKELAGREFKEGDAWTFTVTSDTDGAPMPEHTTVTTDATSGYTDTLDFGKISYTLADAGKTYVYIITESGSVAHVENDTDSTRMIKVTVSDNGDGTLKVEKHVEGKELTFVNTYSESGMAEIQVAKEFNADEYPTGKDAFTFTLKDAQNDVGTKKSPLPEQTTVTVTGANAVSFGDITFDTNGTYNYTVEENAGTLPNVIYDKTVYDVQIKVEDGGNADGVKKITVRSKKQADKEYEPVNDTVFTATFSNTKYAVNVKKTDLTGVKEVKGATITVYKASDINEDGTVKENAEKVTEFVSDGGANDISEKLIRGEQYVLVETSAPEGYAFTNNIPFTLNEDGTVTVDKELQAEDGTILVKDALIGEQKVPLTATKTLTGAALTGDDFSFTLEEVKEDGTTELLQTKTNDAAGKVAFDDLTYDYKAEGKTFTYVVKETDTQKTGITYSKEAYTVKVVISKADTEGKMTAEVSYTDAAGKAADAMNFTNTFAGSVSLVKVDPQQQKLAGAKFMLYQQQASTDYKAYAETEYVTDANGNIKVEGLPEGNYYFVETTAPDGYVIKMNDDGTAKQYPFTIQAGKAEATVGVDIDLGLIENDTITPGEGGDIDLGSVTIEKSVLNAAGKTITADGTTFYAGVFSKNQDGTYKLVKSATLEQNGKVTIKDLTVGTYYLFETTKQGDRINEADFAFEITGNGQEFQIKSDENTDVKLVNKEKETVESEEETEKESEVKTETKTKKTTTVKTGDTTPIALYVGLLAAAAVLIALIVFLRKRKNK